MKSCLFCKHFVYHGEVAGYSDWTPGSPARWACGLHYSTCDDKEPPDIEKMRSLMIVAESCGDFELTTSITGEAKR